MGYNPKKKLKTGNVSPVGGMLNAGGGGGGGGPAGLFTSEGGALGKTDVLGQQFDKMNPYVTGAKKAEEQAAKIGAETGPRPVAEAFKSTLNPDGTLGANYKATGGPAVTAGQVTGGGLVTADGITAGQLDLKSLGSDKRAIDAMRDRATAPGDSPWLKMATEKQGLEELSARDQAAQQAMSGGAMARSSLAMKGGLGGGSRERIAMGASRDMNAARQSIGRAGQLDRMGLGIADDQTKMALLGQTANLDLAHGAQQQDMSKFNIGTKLGADTTNAGNKLTADSFNSNQAFDLSKTNTGNKLMADTTNSQMTQQNNQFNTGNTIAGLGAENTFNSNKYGADMGEWAASKQAQAIAAGGGKK